jgi:hypothetical protein
MRRLAAAILLALAVSPAAAEDELPKFPKAGPPQPLPEATCDVGKADAGDWLLGGWVAPQTRLTFRRQGADIAWSMDRKGSGGEFGWQEGAVIDGRVAAVSACTLRLVAGTDGAFTFEGVLTEDGRIFGYATNKAGADVRFVLRRER